MYTDRAICITTSAWLTNYIFTFYFPLHSTAYNGTKMILFGGLTSGGSAVGNLYILDVQSLTWNLTATAPSSQSRYGMACSVSGDNFIIWGGMHLICLQLRNSMAAFSKNSKIQCN